MFADNKPYQIKLVNNLDWLQDGYYIDILGSGNYLKSDMPVIGHNCKQGLYADEAFILKKDETIYAPTVDKYLTIAGVNNYVLDYTSLVRM